MATPSGEIETQVRNENWVHFAILLLIAVVLLPMLFYGHPFQRELQLGFVLLLLATTRKIGSAVVLLALQAILIVYEPGAEEKLLYPIDAYHLAVPLFGLLMLIVIDRYRTWRGLSLELAPGKKSSLFPVRNWLNSLATSQDAFLRGLDRAFLWQLGRAALMAAVCIALSVAVLRSVPLDRLAPEKARLMAWALRAIILGFALTAVYLVVSILLGELIWRKLSPQQARAYLRGSIAGWMEYDWRGVVRRRVKLRLRQAKESNLKTGPAADGSAQVNPKESKRVSVDA